MGKRILSGVLLCCIIVPTCFWAFDLIKVSVNPNSIATRIYDSAYRFKKMILDMVAEGWRKTLEDEYKQIVEDIDVIENILGGKPGDSPPLNSEALTALRKELDELRKRREVILNASTEELLKIDKERLQAEQHFLVKLRSHSVKEEWKSVTRMVTIEANMAKHSSRLQQEKAAATVNKFIDAVLAMNVDQCRELSGSGLRQNLSLARVRKLRASAPPELEDGFEIRDGGKSRLDVFAGTKKVSTLTQQDGSWVLEEAWE